MLPHAVQVACFDTAFHASIADAAATYALPREWIAKYGSEALRIPRPVARVGKSPRRRVGSRRAADHYVPPRGRRVAVRSARRRIDRHHDGLHPARGPGHGDPFRRRRPRAADVAGAARTRPRGRARPRFGPERSRGHRRHARVAGASTTTMPSSPSRSTCTGSARASARWPHHWAALTCACSPAASVRTRPRSAAARSTDWASSASPSTTASTAPPPVTPTSPRHVLRRAHARHRSPGGPRDGPPGASATGNLRFGSTCAALDVPVVVSPDQPVDRNEFRDRSHAGDERHEHERRE